jgi:aspartate/methionine/tyrosine aminotransferase
MTVARRIGELFPSGIRAVMALAAAREAAGRPVIHMEVGQPDFPTPPHIVEAAFKATRAGFTGYTPNTGIVSLREAIAQRTAARTGVAVDVANVCVTSGAVMAIYLALMAIIEPGDEVLIPDPGWPNYRSAVGLAGGTVSAFELDRNAGFAIDLARLKQQIGPHTRAIIINYPGNPTGAVIDAGAMAALLALADRHGLTVISDEVYEDFVFDGNHVSALHNDGRHRLIVISGASKSYAMTGWRIGWMIARPEIIDAAAKLIEPVTSCPAAVSQAAAEAAIRGPQDCVADMKQAYKRRARLAADILKPAGLLLAEPAGAFYAMANISKSGMGSDAFTRTLLDKTGVAVAPGATFGPSSDNTVRISTAIDDRDVVEGCTRIKAFLGAA